MRKNRFFAAGGMILAVLSLAVIALSVSTSAGGKGSSPIEFRWAPGAVFEKKIAAHIENANALLAISLTEIRRNPDAVTPAMMFNRFKDTYLRNPTLYVEGSDPLTGWDAVLDALKIMVSKSDFVSPQAVTVQLEYVPYDLKGRPAAETDVDIIARIRTGLGIIPHRDPDIGGDLRHIRVCDIIP